MTAVDGDIHADVAEVLVRYATGIDRRDWTLFRTCFTDDCDADYGEIGRWRGVDEITDWMARTHEPCGDTLHRITNVTVTTSGDGVDARSYVDALVLFGSGGSGVRAAGFYDDHLVHDGRAGWRIVRRRFTSVLVERLDG